MLHYFSLQARETPKRLNKYVIAGVLFLMAITYYLATPTLCKLEAASVNDYCKKFTLSINNSSTSSFSNKPILFENVDMASWNSNDYIDDFGWSIYPYQASLANEYNVLLQDIDAVSSNQWYILPSITPGDSTLQILLGANDIQRNQGIYFTGLDYLKVNNHNDFNQSYFSFTAVIEDPVIDSGLGPHLPSIHTFLEKYDETALTGVEVQYLNNVGGAANANSIHVKTDNSTTCSSDTFNGNSLNNFNISVQVSTGSILIYVYDADGNLEEFESCFVGINYSTNTEDVYVGATYDSSLTTPTTSDYLDDLVIRQINIHQGQTTSPIIATYGFNPSDLNQTSAANPNYAGTIVDNSLNGTNHVANYYFNRDQSNFSVTASAIVDSSASGSTIFSSETPDLVGRWWGSSNPGNKVDGNANFFGLTFLIPDANLGLPDDLWYSLWLSAFGLVMAIGIFWLFQSIPISLFAASIPLVLGTIQGLLAAEFIVIWFLLFLAIYSTFQWYERS